MPRERLSTTDSRSGAAKGSASRPRKPRTDVPTASAATAQQRRAIVHQRLVAGMRPVPFQHGEFRMVQGAALAVAEHPRQREQLRLARRQQRLAGEFRRGVQVEWRPRGVGPHDLGGEGMQVRFRCPATPEAHRSPPRRNPPPRSGAAAPRQRGCAPSGRGDGRHERAAATTATPARRRSSATGARWKAGYCRRNGYGPARFARTRPRPRRAHRPRNVALGSSRESYRKFRPQGKHFWRWTASSTPC